MNLAHFSHFVESRGLFQPLVEAVKSEDSKRRPGVDPGHLMNGHVPETASINKTSQIIRIKYYFVFPAALYF
jgi:riboflavin synthase alpha subunit